MVQGLAFLSKKSWHTKNLANQERVWMSEQQKAAEESKTKELARQIQQEREQEELERLTGQTNKNKLDRGIDWMYHHGSGELAKQDADRKAEEFLLGKEYVPDGKLVSSFSGAGGGDFVVTKPPSETASGPGLETVLPKAASAPATTPPEGFPQQQDHEEGPSVAERNEAFRLQHEDPMFLVSQQRRAKQHRADQKRELYQRVVGGESSLAAPKHHQNNNNDDDDSYHNRDRKRRRKDRKKKKKKRKRSRDDDDDRKVRVHTAFVKCLLHTNSPHHRALSLFSFFLSLSLSRSLSTIPHAES